MKMDGSQQEENLDVAFHRLPRLWTWHSALAVSPRGRVVEIFGPESSGKTTLCLEAIAQCQKMAASAHSSMPSMLFDPISPANSV